MEQHGDITDFNERYLNPGEFSGKETAASIAIIWFGITVIGIVLVALGSAISM